MGVQSTIYAWALCVMLCTWTHLLLDQLPAVVASLAVLGEKVLEEGVGHVIALVEQQRAHRHRVGRVLHEAREVHPHPTNHCEEKRKDTMRGK